VYIKAVLAHREYDRAKWKEQICLGQIYSHSAYRAILTHSSNVSPPAAIHDNGAYENAMDIVNRLTSLPRLTKRLMKYLDTLTILVERYENETEGVEPQGIGKLAVLRFLMENRNLTASDLGRLLGDRSLGPKILSGNGALSKTHIKILAKRFHVSAATPLG
jgi:antitoxin component HigA of HigAB toxin-antitoxin module